MTPAGYRAWGALFALAGTIAFAFRPVLIKLGYAAAPVSATTLLFLRMTLSLPFFLAMAWWMRDGGPISRRDWLGIVGLGFLGYYLASLLDFLGLQYVPAGLGRLIMFLYPTLVVILSWRTEIATAQYAVKWLAEPVCAKRPGGRRWARNLCALHPILQEHYGSWLEGAPLG